MCTWTPTEAQGPGTYLFNLRVTDDGLPARSATRQVKVTVIETNRPPVLAIIAGQRVEEGSQLSLPSLRASGPSMNNLTLAWVGAWRKLIRPQNFAWTPSKTKDREFTTSLFASRIMVLPR